MEIFDENGKLVNYKVYESTEIKMAREFIQSDDYVLELGARYGGVSCEINKKLKNKKYQVVVEPDSRVWEVLEKNRDRNNCEFEILKGTISKNPQKIIMNSRKFNDNNDWATYCEESFTSGGTGVQNFNLPNKPFNVLVADCEGFLETFYRENMELFPKLRCIMIEKDRREYCNYEYLESEFLRLGFQIVYKDRSDGFHTVYQRRCTKIPKIFYINLDKRTDRRTEMEQMLEGYDYERISAIEDDDGYIGCAKSHIQCIQMAKGLQYDKIIILEDDFMFMPGWNFKNMELPEKYDCFLLCNRIKKHTKIDKTFSRVHECSWTSGHILDKNIYDDLIQNLKDGIKYREKNGKRISNNLDIYWNKLWEKYVCITHNTIFATQRDGYSDIINTNVNRMKQQNIESKFH
jgi:hypothetical protein